MMVQKMSNDIITNTAGGWVSQALRPVREDNDGQFDDCDESPYSDAQKSEPEPLLPVANEFDADEKIRLKSGETKFNVACSETKDGVTAFDVLSGRGGGTNNHPGNQYFRRLCDQCRPKYVLARKMEKREIARDIVATIRSRGGRFLKKDEKTGVWYDIGDAKATSKTSQALREGLASKMRQALMASGAPKMAQALMATTTPLQSPIMKEEEREMPPLPATMASTTHHTPILNAEEREMPPLPPLPLDEPSASRVHMLEDPSSEYVQDSKRQRVSI